MQWALYLSCVSSRSCARLKAAKCASYVHESIEAALGLVLWVAAHTHVEGGLPAIGSLHEAAACAAACETPVSSASCFLATLTMETAASRAMHMHMSL